MTDAAQTADQGGRQRGLSRPSLFTLMVGAVVLGIASGLFLGELTAGLRLVGDIYIGLLQMTVLPYIVFALISSIGRLSLAESKRLAAIALTVLAVLWAIGCVTVGVMSLSFPARESGAFFSTSLIESQPGVDFIQLFIPSNPFGSLANNVPPAVVVFCIVFGVALVGVKRKEDLLKHFDTIVATLLRVNKFVANLAPVGILAITSAAAGSLSLEEFGRLQAYLLVFAFCTIFVTFWALPMLIAVCTPFTYREILSVSKNALLTVLVIQSLFVVIPMLAEGVRQLAQKHQRDGVKAEPDFVIPIAYSFPHLGKVLTLIFVPFAAWFYGTTIPWADYPTFLATGLVLSFGKVVTTIPFLLDVQELPSDIFKLFLVSSVFAGGFSDVIGAMHLMAFTTLTICAMSGLIRIKRTKLLVLIGFSFVIAGAMILSARTAIDYVVGSGTHGPPIVRGMQLMENPVPSEVLPVASPNPVPLEPGQSRLDRMIRRGVLRAGFRPDDLPFSFFNEKGELVGLDIEMAHELARDLGVAIEFVPLDYSNLAEHLAADAFDIAFSGLAATTRRAAAFYLSAPYINLTLSFVVRDHQKKEFANLETIRRRDEVRIGVPAGVFFEHEIRAVLPNAKIVQLDSEREFFEDPPEPMDVLLFSAEGGSAWTLIHPQYTVVSLANPPTKIPVAYPYGGPDQRLKDFLSHWIHLQREDNTLEQLYDYWILGTGAETREPRWSVIRDVLGWVD